MPRIVSCPAMPACEKMPMIDQCRRFFDDTDLALESTLNHDHRGARYRVSLAAGSGDGWMEVRQVYGGLAIGRSDYLLARPDQNTFSNYETPLGFSLLLSGGFAMNIPAIGLDARVCPGQMWIRRGPYEMLRYTAPAGKVIRGVALDLSPEMIEAWRNEAPGRLNGVLSKLLRDPGPLCDPFCCDNHLINRIAARMLEVNTDTVGADLLLESLALDLLAHILSLDFSTRCCPNRSGPCCGTAVDEAVDILDQEWTDPPTISALARRVGLNACYLKVGFRRRVGLTIGEYVRKRRMEAALRMLECDGCTVLQAASAVGYTNPSHFSAAFKQYHGRLPSHYSRRAAWVA